MKTDSFSSMLETDDSSLKIVDFFSNLQESIWEEACLYLADRFFVFHAWNRWFFQSTKMVGFLQELIWKAACLYLEDRFFSLPPCCQKRQTDALILAYCMLCSQAWSQAADIGRGNSFRAMCDRHVVNNGTCAEGRENHHPTRQQQQWAPARKDCQLGMKTFWQITGSRDALSQLLRTLSPIEWFPPALTLYTTATDHKSFSRDTLHDRWYCTFLE